MCTEIFVLLFLPFGRPVCQVLDTACGQNGIVFQRKVSFQVFAQATSFRGGYVDFQQTCPILSKEAILFAVCSRFIQHQK